MKKVLYQPEGIWFGDCMPYYHNGRFYLFHQRDTRTPGPLVESEPFGWALAVTEDFVTYVDHGEALARGDNDAQDQFIYAGSIFGEEGRFTAMYTGFNRDYVGTGKAAQVLMRAESDDLLHWRKTGRRLVEPQPGYDPDEWRDPWVIRDEENHRYVMLIGTRKLEGGKIATGCIVWFTSTDMEHWTFEGDFWAPGLFYVQEMPEIFFWNGWWYLVYTEYSDASKTRYRMSRSLNGPWLLPPGGDDAFDGRAYYAARSCCDGNRRFLFGWVPTRRDECDDRSDWVWGGTLLVHEVLHAADGHLEVIPVESIVGAFGAQKDLPCPPAAGRVDGDFGIPLTPGTTDHFCLKMRIKLEKVSGSLSLRLFEDSTTGDAYEFRLDAPAGQISFDKVPAFPWYRYDNRGISRPFRLSEGMNLDMTLLVDDTIATLYVNGTALSTRMYDKRGRAASLHCADCAVTVESVSISEL